MKKMFTSLMLGFGAALGVFVALAMPPGGWGVAIGVGLGLLGCLPLLLVLVLLINRGQPDQRSTRRDYDEPAQPIVIIQQPPAFQGPSQEPPYYEMYAGPQAANYGYMDAPDYYAAPLEPRLRREQRADPRRLQPTRRRPAPDNGYYRPQPEYYPQPRYDQEYYAEPEYAEDEYYDSTSYEQYEQAYYDSRQEPVYLEEPVARPRAVRRSPTRRALRAEDAVEAEFRTIGDNE